MLWTCYSSSNNCPHVWDFGLHWHKSNNWNTSSFLQGSVINPDSCVLTNVNPIQAHCVEKARKGVCVYVCCVSWRVCAMSDFWRHWLLIQKSTGQGACALHVVSFWVSLTECVTLANWFNSLFWALISLSFKLCPL